MDILAKSYTNRHDDRASPKEAVSLNMDILAKSYTNTNRHDDRSSPKEAASHDDDESNSDSFYSCVFVMTGV